MKKLLRSTFLIQLLLFLPLMAKAELVQGEGYAGVSLGVPLYDKLETTDVGFKVFGGYMLYDFLGLDISYVNLGDPENNNKDLAVSGANVAALLSFPVNQQISLFGKVGSFVWDAKSDSDSNSSGNDISLSLGADFNAKDNVFIHGEIERYAIDNETILMYSIGLMVGF